ncbi:D-sedoheptulose-7-phosphate isomerase [Solirhodobacter olei]|uniref:D-sedoheptulose-7-phosphate isomerase n=1 Tax=Solirhodobacter olei TaxID=2493082 RepID=UPI001F4DAA79|nr:SIS domain-containing protein [Solirhodobacter olei]
MISIDEYLTTVSKNFETLREMAADIEAAASICVQSLRSGGKVIFCGNGGSAADSQHLAAELMGRFLVDRAPLPALALTVDTSALTAIGNDYGYDLVFARQLRGIGREGDVLIGLSTSGTSANVVRAFEVGSEIGIRCIALTGSAESPLSKMAALAVRVPSNQTNHIQEMHIAIGHIICGIVEIELCSDKP